MISDGAILVDKHLGITSFDVVAQLKRILRIKRVGHCGTLDPLAEGVVIVCFGRATKLTRFIADADKSYTADILLGKTTETFDRYGVVTEEVSTDGLSESEIEEALRSFEGEIRQMVPPYSASKLAGKPLYKYARENVDVPVKYRSVRINRIEIQDMSLPHVRINVDCSKGTYIRSLAHELGRKLGCGAHLHSLVRTRIGRFTIDDSLSLTQIAARTKLGLLESVLLRLPELLDFPSLTVPDSIHAHVRNGRDIHSKDIERFSAEFAEGDSVAVVGREGQLLAVGEALAASARFCANNLVDQPVFKYKRVL